MMPVRGAFPVAIFAWLAPGRICGPFGPAHPASRMARKAETAGFCLELTADGDGIPMTGLPAMPVTPFITDRRPVSALPNRSANPHGPALTSGPDEHDTERFASGIVSHEPGPLIRRDDGVPCITGKEGKLLFRKP